MKHGILRSIGHNLADSLASGCCLLVGIYDIDIRAEIASANGLVSVDFLTGTVVSTGPSPLLVEAMRRYRLALSDLCARQSVSVDSFRHLTAQFWSTETEARFSVTVEDSRGRRTTTEYGGNPGHRIKIADRLGRLRPKSIAA